jgi:hypothetical protein
MTWLGLKSKRQEKKHQLVLYKGGKCLDCNHIFPDCCFHFDHRDPSTKLFSISSGLHRSLEELKREADKCDLVCANCHAIRTAGSPAIAAKIRGSQTGTKRGPMSEEHKAKIGMALRGRVLGPRHRS